jgi:hypothetical protein
MVGKESMYFDPETLALLRETLDSWASLRPEQQATMQKTALAERMLKSARLRANVIASACVTPCWTLPPNLR